MNRTALFFRALHVLFGLYLFTILGIVYYCGITGETGVFLWIAAGSLLAEGLILLLWRGRCPISLVQERHGDDKGFFGLFLPRKAWPFVLPILSVVSAIGLLLVAVNCL
ncbi:MAG: hypothetical protein ACYTHM_02930 [Planctomycetota bacterium]|jgi:hypothetical protein